MGSRMDLTFAEVTQFLVYDIVSRVYPRARGQGIFKLDINLSFNSTGSTQEELRYYEIAFSISLHTNAAAVSFIYHYKTEVGGVLNYGEYTELS